MKIIKKLKIKIGHRMKVFFTKIYILLFFFVSYPALSDEQYACFTPQKQSPKKVVVGDTHDIYITWKKFPMKYNFMLFSNGIIVAGRMHIANNTLQDFKNLFDENLDAFEKLQKDIVVFDKSNMKLSYSSILGNGYANVGNMKCVSVD